MANEQAKATNPIFGGRFEHPVLRRRVSGLLNHRAIGRWTVVHAWSRLVSSRNHRLRSRLTMHRNLGTVHAIHTLEVPTRLDSRRMRRWSGNRRRTATNLLCSNGSRRRVIHYKCLGGIRLWRSMRHLGDTCWLHRWLSREQRLLALRRLLTMGLHWKAGPPSHTSRRDEVLAPANHMRRQRLSIRADGTLTHLRHTGC